VESTAEPNITIVIPVYNEEGILRSSIVDLIDRIAVFGWRYQILLAENGSIDRTVEIAADLSARFPEVECFSVGRPGHGNYGAALREGILRARGRFVVCEEIDLCDTDFHRRALEILERGEADLVIGSKLAEGARDERPLVRHLASLVMNGLLRVSLGFRGTDTHGLKAFRREAMTRVAERCVVDRDLFASELVIRAEREGVAIREIPVRVKEKRDPSIHLFRRVPNVIKNLVRLVIAIRFK
jgi:glycosyltransferase involved in cell wall biosynthesis